MADEIKIRAELSVVKGATWDGLAVRDLLITMTGTNVLHNRQNVGTTEEALLLGDCAAGSLVLLINRDLTNHIAVKAASGAASLIKLLPGEVALFRLHSTAATAPFVHADTAPCELEYFLVEP